jgi:hypothetical protein
MFWRKPPYSATEIAELMCSSLCHDIANPASSVINCVEMLPDGDAEVQSILEQSSAALGDCIRLYRVAYGRISLQQCDMESVMGYLEIALKGKTTPDVSGGHEVLTVGAVKALVNLAVLSGAIFIGSYTFMVKISDNGATIELGGLATTPGAQELLDILAGTAKAINYDNARAHYIRAIAEEHGLALSVRKRWVVSLRGKIRAA